MNGEKKPQTGTGQDGFPSFSCRAMGTYEDGLQLSVFTERLCITAKNHVIFSVFDKVMSSLTEKKMLTFLN